MKRNFMRASVIGISVAAGSFGINMLLTRVPVLNRIPETIRPAVREGTVFFGAALAFFLIKK